MRYMVRKEFFGAYVYDRKFRMYLLFDKESYEILNNIDQNYEYIYKLDKDIIEFLKKEEFILNNGPNYYVVDNGEYSGVLSAPMRMHLMYTKECNLNCIHCFTHEDAKSMEKDMTFSQKVKILDEMKKIGMCEILIGGGEPFLENDIFDFVRECNKRDIVVKIFTNGLLLNNEFEKLLQMDIAYLAISIDGYDQMSYKKTRGSSNFDTIKNNIIKLKKNECKYPIVISTTINSYNCEEPGGFLKLTQEVKADRLKIRATKPSGNINLNKDVMIEPTEYKTFLLNIQKLYNEQYRDKFGLDLTWGDFRVDYNIKDDCLEVLETDLPYNNYGCVAAKTSMCINSDGTGIPCGFLPISADAQSKENVVKRGILEVWHTGKSFLELRNMAGNDMCNACEIYETCRGGCVARNIFYKNDKDGVDPWCIKKYFPIFM